MRTSSSSTNLAGPVYRVKVEVAGLSEGHTGTMRVRVDDVAAAITFDPRCGPLNSGEATCRVSSTPTTYDFMVATVPTQPVTITFIVTPDGAAIDPDKSDNSTSERLG